MQAVWADIEHNEGATSSRRSTPGRRSGLAPHRRRRRPPPAAPRAPRAVRVQRPDDVGPRRPRPRPDPRRPGHPGPAAARPRPGRAGSSASSAYVDHRAGDPGARPIRVAVSPRSMPRRGTSPDTPATAASISATTSSGWDTIGTWLDATSTVVAPMRAANGRPASGGIASSLVATRNHEGRARQAGTPMTSSKVESEMGCWTACMTFACAGSTSAAKCPTKSASGSQAKPSASTSRLPRAGDGGPPSKGADGLALVEAEGGDVDEADDVGCVLVERRDDLAAVRVADDDGRTALPGQDLAQSRYVGGEGGLGELGAVTE